jgi:hypothetical protein
MNSKLGSTPVYPSDKLYSSGQPMPDNSRLGSIPVSSCDKLDSLFTLDKLYSLSHISLAYKGLLPSQLLSFFFPSFLFSQIAVSASTCSMPLPNPRITHLAAKHSSALSPATSLILEPCIAMSRPRVARSILERKSAHPTMRVSPRSQPLPAARQPTHKVKSSTAETAALIKRARALLAKPVAVKLPALEPCVATFILDRSAARKERIPSATLKLKETGQPGKL